MYDPMLLSPELRELAHALIKEEGRQAQVRSGCVISTLRTRDTIGGICFYPQSSRLLAVEGKLNRTADAIYVFDVFGDKPGDMSNLCGHTSFPIGVDIDPSGRFAATVHAKGEVYIWPGQDIQHLEPGTPPAQVSTPSCDASGKIILAREGDYGSIRILDTCEEREIRLPSMNPSHAASIGPAGDWLARFYWEQLPINPYSMEADAEEATERWWAAFRAQVPVCCYIEAVPPQEKGARLAWRLSPNVTVGPIAFDPTGQSGAALLSHESGPSVFVFSPSNKTAGHIALSARLKPFGLHMPRPGNLVLFSEADGEVVAHHLRLGDRDVWSILFEFREFGPRKDITCGPIPFGDDLFALVTNDYLLQVYGARPSCPPTNGPTRAVMVSEVASVDSSDGIFDIASGVVIARKQL